MIVWSGVYLYGGLINEMRCFLSKEDALKWFLSISEAVGGKDVCEEGDYDISDSVMKFYDSLGRQDTEIWIQPVEVE